MTDRDELEAAQRATHAGQYSEAIPTFKKLAKEKSAVGGEAAYCLAILYETGHGLAQSSELAESFFRESEIQGYAPAICQLAGYSLRKRDLDGALKRYISVAEQNPLAAYWVYRVLTENPQLRTRDNEEEIYVDLAARQGHLMARKAQLLAEVKGKKGVAAIPRGLAGFMPLFIAMFRAVRRGDKSKFT